MNNNIASGIRAVFLPKTKIGGSYGTYIKQ
jgi:hypothetical protein